MSFLILMLIIFLFLLIKYYLLYGCSYYFFWIFKPKWINKYKIQAQPRALPQVKIEIFYSMYSLIILSLVLTPLLYFSYWGQIQFNHNSSIWFKIYKNSSEQSFASELTAVLIYIIYYDAYFYFSHRFLHSKWLFKKVHFIHHKSLNPTPFSSYSFHPIEAFINVIYLIPYLYFIPISFVTLLILHLFSDFSNWNGHLGYDFSPKGTLNFKIGLTTPTHHNLHHQYAKFNFGLYWNGWDYFFKTLHPQTEQEFNRVKNQK